MIRFQGQSDNFTAGGFDDFASGDPVGPVRALDQDVGQQVCQDGVGCILVKYGYRVDGRQGADKLSPLGLGQNRPLGSFQATDAGITVKGHDQPVSERPSALQESDMAGVQQIVAPIRKHNLLSRLRPLPAECDQFRAGQRHASF